MRARKALTELRARELAFTVDEARALIAHEGVELSAGSVELLVERTEGWPAGLYLAALWLRELDQPNERVRAFAGNARQVGDYLADEVLSALAPATREFLVRTSVLGRFTPELCDAVLGREDSSTVLAELARSNMFLVALDASDWYRYHRLFGEVLQLELGHDAALELRRSAAAWCRGHGLVEDAIEYAAAANNPQMVAELLLEHHLAFIWAGRLGQFLGWIEWLPAEVLAGHPLLPSLVFGVVLERNTEANAVVDELAVLDCDVLSQNFGHAEVAHGLRRRVDRASGGCLPRLAANANHLGHAVDAVGHAAVLRRLGLNRP